MRQCRGDGPSGRTDAVARRLLDVFLSLLLLVVLAPLVAAVALAVKVDSRGPVLYRCRRIGLAGTEFAMLKFRKMVDGATSRVLTTRDDDRFTRVGRFLARTKLDEVPQLWNVVRGEMSLVGPRPEDPRIVAPRRAEYEPILRVRPGVTGLSQLAFAREAEILDVGDPVRHYVSAILPQKLRLDGLYAGRPSLWLNVRILAWTFAAVLFRTSVAVNRSTGTLGRRKRPSVTAAEQTAS